MEINREKFMEDIKKSVTNFIQFLKKKIKNCKEPYHKIFDSLDIDKDGIIQHKEFVKIFKELGLSLDYDFICQVFDVFDQRKINQIQYMDFLCTIFGNELDYQNQQMLDGLSKAEQMLVDIRVKIREKYMNFEKFQESIDFPNKKRIKKDQFLYYLQKQYFNYSKIQILDLFGFLDNMNLGYLRLEQFNQLYENRIEKRQLVDNDVGEIEKKMNPFRN